MPGETEYATVNTLFKEGMAHATIAGPWLIPTVRESGMDVEIASMPVIDETGKPIAPYMGVQGVQVLKMQQRIKGCGRAGTAGTDEGRGGYCAGTGQWLCSCQRNCYSYEEVSGDEVVMAMKETAEMRCPCRICRRWM